MWAGFTPRWASGSSSSTPSYIHATWNVCNISTKTLLSLNYTLEPTAHLGRSFCSTVWKVCHEHMLYSPSWSWRKTRARQRSSQSFIAVAQRVFWVTGRVDEVFGSEQSPGLAGCGDTVYTSSSILNKDKEQQKKKWERISAEPLCQLPPCSEWKLWLQSPLLAKSVNYKMGVKSLENIVGVGASQQQNHCNNYCLLLATHQNISVSLLTSQRIDALRKIYLLFVSAFIADLFIKHGVGFSAYSKYQNDFFKSPYYTIL